ncbi:MAG TPA: hypothetical protein VMH85_18020 [Terriglobales bacterium]|nr:hypothetical protein [Terriglobales bacterium]
MSFDLAANRRVGPDLLITLPVLLLVIFALPWIAFRVAYQQYVLLLVGVLIFADICFTFAWWRASVYLFAVYVLVEGFLINTYSEPALNLLKDVQLILIFFRLALALIARRTFPVPHTGWIVPYFLFAIYYIAEIFNPLLPTILVGLIGARVTLEFFLCFIVGYWFFNDRAQVMRFLQFHNWVSIPIAAFGILQYFTGPDLLLRISPGFQRAIFYANDPKNPQAGFYFRTISTFASTAGLSQYLWVAAILSIALMLVSPRPFDKMLARVALLVQACGILSTGSRGPFLLLFVSIFLGFWLMRQMKQAVLSAALLVACLIVSMLFLGPVVKARFASLLDLDMIRDRNMALAVGEFGYAMESPIVGYGAGIGCAAANRLDPNLDVVGSENQFARIRNEGGLAGLVLFFALTVALFVETWRQARWLRDPQFRIIGCLATTIPLINILLFPIGQPLDIPPTNFYFWFLLGLLQALVVMEASERAAGVPPVPLVRTAWSWLR